MIFFHHSLPLVSRAGMAGGGAPKTTHINGHSF